MYQVSDIWKAYSAQRTKLCAIVFIQCSNCTGR